MNLKQQYEFIDQFYQDALSVITSRQSDYAPDGVALLNVLASCVRWNQEPFQVLGNLLDKQTTALQHLCMHGHVHSDPPQSRMRDAANYFAFFAMWLERQEELLAAWKRHWEAEDCRCHAVKAVLSPDAQCVRCKTLLWIVRHENRA